MAAFLGPIPGQLVIARYHIDQADWTAMDPCERAMFRLAYAADVIHVEEVPRGSNSGPEVERIQHLAGSSKGEPWCASSETAYLIDSGVQRKSLPENAASVHGWGEWAKEKGRLLEHPVRACVGLIYHTASTGHLVVVTGVGSRTVDTLSGNTNSDGSREGYGIFRKVYPIDRFAHFVDVRRLS